MEIWKDVVGLEGRYQVSNLGNVCRLKHTIYRSCGRPQKFDYKPMGCYNNRGYLQVHLPPRTGINSKPQSCFVHRIVAEAFLENPENKCDVNHINGVKDDNRLENLEWATRSENIQNMIDRTGRKGTKYQTQTRESFDSLEGEIWKPYPSDTKYEASNLGRIRRKEIVVVNPIKGTFKNKPIMLKQKLTHEGYFRVCINRTTKLAHRIIAEAFIPNPDNKPFVNHKDSDRTNNSVDNLEWCSSSENIKHAFATGNKKSITGVDHKMSKLTESDVKSIRNCMHIPSPKLAKIYNVNESTIKDVKNNKTWKHVSPELCLNK